MVGSMVQMVPRMVLKGVLFIIQQAQQLLSTHIFDTLDSFEDLKNPRVSSSCTLGVYEHSKSIP